MKSQEIENIIYASIEDAEKRHPKFPEKIAEAISIIGEEYGEVCKAVNENDRVGLVIELSHVIVACIRTLERL